MPNYKFQAWLAVEFPWIQYPIDISVTRTLDTYFLRVIDSDGTVELIKMDRIPKSTIEEETIIINLCKSDKDFAKYFNGR